MIDRVETGRAERHRLKPGIGDSLRQRLVAELADLTQEELAARIEERLDRWSMEFKSESAPGGND